MVKLEISNVFGSRSAYVLKDLIKKEKGRDLILVSSDIRAQNLASDLSFFVDKKILVLRGEREIFSNFEAKDRQESYERLGYLLKALGEEDAIVIAPSSLLLKKLIPLRNLESHILQFKVGEHLDIEETSKKLVEMGYERTKIIYSKGQFSLRGSILDVFSPLSDKPIRIDLFDDEIEKIKIFDVDSQSSIESIEEVRIEPSTLMIYDEEEIDRFRQYLNKNYKSNSVRREELLSFACNRENLQQLEFYANRFYENTENLLDYLKPRDIFVEDIFNIEENLNFLMREFKERFVNLVSKGNLSNEDYNNFENEGLLTNLIDYKNITVLENESKIGKGKYKASRLIEFQASTPVNFNRDNKSLHRELARYERLGYKKIRIVCETQEKLTAIKEILGESSKYHSLEFLIGILSQGIDDKIKKEVYITDIEILGGFHKKRNVKPKKYRNTRAIESFTDIKQGDYVVHEDHGVGQYLGIVQLRVDDILKDLIHIKYGGEDNLYVPVDQLGRVQKYIGSEGQPPKIYKLNGRDWQNTKNKAREAVLEMAKEIIEVSAIRKAEKGFAFSKDSSLQEDFERSFAYEETADQLRCIEEIKEDMQRDIPMDRLLCGDVGYGKTEVAARAMFKCVLDSKQVAMLVPTTILADQHYHNLKARFKDFPVNIQMVSRFNSPKKQRQIISQIKSGEVDIVIGTHRLLSKDVDYKDLGLLIIDEEQRFGVGHKEKIKNLKEKVDVLSLSATPIPRTLHMSLLGIRNMSLIEEPPRDRIPVQTYVVEEEDYIIKEAIVRELGRGGQVFVVVNKINGIENLAKRLEELVPESKISIAHGQMSEKDLEDTMIEFIEGQTNVLISTTIIESGIDIPNANTQIVIDADKFGLSQLYQLRGRVGRSNKVAYAYLTHKKDKVLSEVSEKRLKAIKEFTEFGAGFKIAMRDLEIRGAGNLLGAQQSGHIVSIGYELYTKLVQEAVAAIRGEIIREESDDLDFEVKIAAYIPNNYISDEALKFDIYRKIAESGKDDEEISIRNHIEDRFGNMPREVMNLIKVAKIRHLASLVGVRRIAQFEDKIIIQFKDKEEKPIRLWLRDETLDDIADILKMLKGKIEEDIVY